VIRHGGEMEIGRLTETLNRATTAMAPAKAVGARQLLDTLQVLLSGDGRSVER